MKVKFACQTPNEHCSAASAPVNNLYNKEKHRKLHSTTEEAFGCYEKYLLSQNFIKVGSREFKSPTDGTIHVLTKKSRYGAPFRYGKEKQNYLPYPGKRKSCAHGTIVE